MQPCTRKCLAVLSTYPGIPAFVKHNAPFFPQSPLHPTLRAIHAASALTNQTLPDPKRWQVQPVFRRNTIVLPTTNRRIGRSMPLRSLDAFAQLLPLSGRCSFQALLLESPQDTPFPPKLAHQELPECPLPPQPLPAC